MPRTEPIDPRCRFGRWEHVTPAMAEDTAFMAGMRAQIQVATLHAALEQGYQPAHGAHVHVSLAWEKYGHTALNPDTGEEVPVPPQGMLMAELVVIPLN